MTRGAAAAVAVFAGVIVVVGGLGWLVYSSGGSGEEAPDVGAPRGDSPVKRALRNRPPPESPPSETPARPSLPTSPDAMARFVFPGHEAVKIRDWKEIAAAWVDFAAITRERVLNGPPKPDDKAAMEKIGAAMRRLHVASAEMPLGVEQPPEVESKERPAFAANLVAALLDAAKMPLSPDQAKRIYEVGLVRTEEVDREAKAPREDDGVTYALDILVTRAEAIDRFFTAMWDTLTPAQAQYVSPAEYRYHCRIDLLSCARMIQDIAIPRPFAEPGKLVQSVTDHLAGVLEVPERRDELRPIVEDWVRLAPIEALDPLERKGLYSTRRLIRDAKRMVDLLRAAVDGLKLPEETAAKARKLALAYVPIPQ